MSEISDLIVWDTTRAIPQKDDGIWHIYTNTKFRQLEVRRYINTTNLCIRIGMLYEKVWNPNYDSTKTVYDRYIKELWQMQFGANNNFFCDLAFFGELLTVVAVARSKAEELGWLLK